ncbi:MAG: sugar transferase [Phototrophicaceae bacterium]|jgi:exopolysaccharide biosynthesis polyprenyl glycosylphosphotransferase
MATVPDQLQVPPNTPPITRMTVDEPAWLMPALDVLFGLFAVWLAYLARYELQLFRAVEPLFLVPFANYTLYALVFVGWLLVNFASTGLYRRTRVRSIYEEITTITNAAATGIVVIMAMSFALQARGFSRLMLLYVAVITIVLLVSLRWGRAWYYAYLRAKRGIGIRRVLVVGAQEVGQAVLRVMLARRDLGYRPVGYLDDDPLLGNVDLGRLRGLGKIDNLATAIHAESVDLVVIALPSSAQPRVSQLVDLCRQNGAEVRLVPDLFQFNLRQVHLENLDGIPLLSLQEGRISPGNRLLKRLLDLALVTLGAPLWVPLFGLVALAIKLDGTGGNVLYRQERVGENGKPFSIFKFRSMIPDADKYRAELVKQYNQDPRFPKIKDDPRITEIGKFIRRTSLDELPNLLNVIRGEMSLVGTRPPTPDEVALYDAWHFQRLKTVPGITGMWQVSGRSEIPFDEVVLLDIYYIENWSIRLDIEILLRTIPRVLLREGAY